MRRIVVALALAGMLCGLVSCNPLGVPPGGVVRWEVGDAVGR
jgi:hypothetical protein